MASSGSKRISITLPTMARARSAGDSVGDMLASFTPSCIITQCFKQNHARSNDPLAHRPAVEGFGAVVFCDISGFTALTERLAKEGPDGSEKLVSFLNDYFGQLVQLVEMSGGDVMMFAGDALLALWRSETVSDIEERLNRLNEGINDMLASGGDQVELSRLRTLKRTLQQKLLNLQKKEAEGHTATPEELEEELKHVTQRAVECAYHMMTLMNKKDDSNQPRLHMGVGAGKICLLQVGGRDDQWAFLVAGEPLLQIGPACGAASPDHTVMSPECWRLAKDICTGEPIEGTDMVRLTGLLSELDSDPLAGVPRPTYPAKIVGQLRMFIPKIIQINTVAGQKTRVAELRRVTCLFINVIGVDVTTAACASEVHRVVYTIQCAMYQDGGVINKIILDDKGFVILAGFGLPPMAHRNDAERGVVAACRAKRDLSAIGVQCSIGITTGHAFCGIVGSEQRREYTMMGDPINTAARLMTATKDSVLCDRNTVASATASSDRLCFEQLKSRKFKGKQVHTEVFRPVLQSAFIPKSIRVYDPPRGTKGLVDRYSELMGLAEAIYTFSEKRQGATVVVESETGLGRTSLLQESLRFANHAGITCFQACGDAAFKKEPFFPFRPLFEEIFEIGSISDDPAKNAEREQKLLEKLATKPLLQNFGPLLNMAMQVNFEENSHTSQLRGKVRVDRLTELLLVILVESSAKKPTALLVEDFDEFDKSSREMVLKAAQARSMLMIIATRTSVDGPTRNACDVLLEGGATAINLSPVSREGIRKIFCKCVGSRTLPPAVTDVVVAKCGGNPFLVEEMAYSTLEHGIIEVVDGRCLLRSNYRELDALVPGTIEAVVMSSFDNLTRSDPGQIQTLKVAAAIGLEFSATMLFDIFPAQMSSQEAFKKQMCEQIAALVASDFIVPVVDNEEDDDEDVLREEPDPMLATYRFTNAIIQQVAYGLMLFKERTKLHRRIAAWYKDNIVIEGPAAHVLAYHWGRGDYISKAVYYFEFAGTASLAENDLNEARLSLNEALTLAEVSETGAEPTSSLTLATLRRKLAEVAFALGEENQAYEFLREAADLLGVEVAADAIIPVLLNVVSAAEQNHADSQKSERAELRELEQRLRSEEHLGSGHIRAWRRKVKRWNSVGQQQGSNRQSSVLSKSMEKEKTEEKSDSKLGTPKFWQRRKLSSTPEPPQTLVAPKRKLTAYEKDACKRFVLMKSATATEHPRVQMTGAEILAIRAAYQVKVLPDGGLSPEEAALAPTAKADTSPSLNRKMSPTPAPKPISKRRCEKCNEVPATISCKACDIVYCKPCSATAHAASGPNASHSLSPVVIQRKGSIKKPPPPIPQKPSVKPALRGPDGEPIRRKSATPVPPPKPNAKRQNSLPPNAELARPASTGATPTGTDSMATSNTSAADTDGLDSIPEAVETSQRVPSSE